MRNMLIALMIGLLTFSFMISDVQAKRFGGGKSFGSSRQVSNSSSASRNAAAAPKPASPASKWLGPLAGLAIGGLLATLFMGNGVGSGMLTWLIIGGLVFFIWRFLRSRIQPSAQAMNNFNFQAQAQPVGNFVDKHFSPSFPSQNNSLETLPSFFDEAGFLRQSKALFIRLQAAYDSKNLTDIREFTNPQVFAEVQLQLQERGDAVNVTEVINIDAQIIDRSDDAKLVSVLFSGLIREEMNVQPIAVKEVWHFEKNAFNSNWIVAGIQQEDESFN